MKRRHPDQGFFGFRRYIVQCNGLVAGIVEAPSASAAKYRAFKHARQAGYFREGFKAFLANGVTVRADRRAIRYGEASPEIGL
ncbi:hypothetical protein [Bradyrhizobium cenepequi]